MDKVCCQISQWGERIIPSREGVRQIKDERVSEHRSHLCTLLCLCRSAEPLVQSPYPRILISRKQTISHLAIAQILLLNISAGHPGEQSGDYIWSTVIIYGTYPQSLQRAASTACTSAELNQIASARVRHERAATCFQVRCIWRHSPSPEYCSCFFRRNIRVKLWLRTIAWAAVYSSAATWNLTYIGSVLKKKWIRFVDKRYEADCVLH